MSVTRALKGLLVVLPLSLVACGEKPAEEAPPALEPMSQAGADAVRNTFINLYMSKDAANASQFYAEDAVMYSPDGTIATGRAAVQAAFEGMMAAGMDSLGMSSTSFEAAGDQATDRGTWILRTLDPETKEATRQKGDYVMVHGRQADGSFKIVKDSVFNATEVPE